MSLPRFFTPHPGLHNVDSSRAGFPFMVEIGGAVTRHMLQVLRLKVGAPLILFTGDGGEFHAVIRAINKQTVSLEIDEFIERDVESELKISLAQGVSRGERMDYTIQKAVELGVNSIVPLKTQRTVVNLKGDNSNKRVMHWQKIVNSACEQCGRNTIPPVCAVEKYTSWLSGQDDSLNTDKSIKILLHHCADESFSSLADLSPAGLDQITLLVGPEGGLSDEENDLALSAGFKPVKMGPRILRTETAAIVALSVIQSRWGDLS